MLQAAEHARERTAVSEQADGNVAVAAFRSDRLREFSVRERQAIPLAVGLLLFWRERHGGSWFSAAAASLNQLLDAALLQIIGPAGALGSISLADVRHFHKSDILRKRGTEPKKSAAKFHRLLRLSKIVRLRRGQGDRVGAQIILPMRVVIHRQLQD